ncbi:hypothetical protein EDC04DRAFT_1491671 [Pisolithus marmoratus]|nr:hypothetical protein EDC04DRAFT_1491671 [Pisolithus marmoratus]
MYLVHIFSNSAQVCWTTRRQSSDPATVGDARPLLLDPTSSHMVPTRPISPTPTSVDVLRSAHTSPSKGWLQIDRYSTSRAPSVLDEDNSNQEGTAKNCHAPKVPLVSCNGFPEFRHGHRWSSYCSCTSHHTGVASNKCYKVTGFLLPLLPTSVVILQKNDIRCLYWL